MDMRFNWMRCRIKQGQFLVYWRKGAENLADYITKHHPASHHREMRKKYIHSSKKYAMHVSGEGVFSPARS